MMRAHTYRGRLHRWHRWGGRWRVLVVHRGSSGCVGLGALCGRRVSLEGGLCVSRAQDDREGGNGLWCSGRYEGHMQLAPGTYHPAATVRPLRPC
jgi:hypothetical protein